MRCRKFGEDEDDLYSGGLVTVSVGGQQHIHLSSNWQFHTCIWRGNTHHGLQIDKGMDRQITSNSRSLVNQNSNTMLCYQFDQNFRVVGNGLLT